MFLICLCMHGCNSSTLVICSISVASFLLTWLFSLMKYSHFLLKPSVSTSLLPLSNDCWSVQCKPTNVSWGRWENMMMSWGLSGGLWLGENLTQMYLCGLMSHQSTILSFNSSVGGVQWAMHVCSVNPLIEASAFLCFQLLVWMASLLSLSLRGQ